MTIFLVPNTHVLCLQIEKSPYTQEITPINIEKQEKERTPTVYDNDLVLINSNRR